MLKIQDANNCQKNCHLGTITQLCPAISSCIDNRKKNLLNSNIANTHPHNMANFGPLMAEIRSGVRGTPTNFNGVRIGFVIPATSLNGNQPNFARCLAICWTGEGATYILRAAIMLGIGTHSSWFWFWVSCNCIGLVCTMKVKPWSA